MNAIRKYRAENGLTLAALGERLAVRKSTIWKYENGNRVPPDMALKIEAETGIPRGKVRPDLWPESSPEATQ